MESGDQLLVETIRRGDEDAAAQLIHLYYQRIYAFLRRLSNNDADAADLTQLTFTRLWQALPGFAGRSSLSSWMHGIAYHIYVDWRRAERPSEPRSEDWWACRPAVEAGPDEILARNDFSARLYTLVDAPMSEGHSFPGFHGFGGGSSGGGGHVGIRGVGLGAGRCSLGVQG